MSVQYVLHAAHGAALPTKLNPFFRACVHSVGVHVFDLYEVGFFRVVGMIG